MNWTRKSDFKGLIARYTCICTLDIVLYIRNNSFSHCRQYLSKIVTGFCTETIRRNTLFIISSPARFWNTSHYYKTICIITNIRRIINSEGRQKLLARHSPGRSPSALRRATLPTCDTRQTWNRQIEKGHFINRKLTLQNGVTQYVKIVLFAGNLFPKQSKINIS